VTNSEEVENIIHQVWPDQSKIVGRAVVRNIAHTAGSDDAFLASRGGANFDPGSALNFLVEGATLVKICVEVWRMLGHSRGSAVDLEKLHTDVSSDPRVGKMRTEVKNRVAEILEAVSHI